MTTKTTGKSEARVPLSRERVFEAAVALADKHGIAELSMRKLGAELDVEAMSLYYHVTNKEEILDGMVDQVISSIDLHPLAADWKTTLRAADHRRAAGHEAAPMGAQGHRDAHHHVVRDHALHG